MAAIQYCYRVHKDDINQAQDVFSFHSVTRDGFVFTVTSSFTVRTTPHQEDECTMRGGMHYFCCDTTTLSANNQLSFSPDNYTFGVTILDNGVMSYAFNKANGGFLAEQVQSSLGTTILVGSSYTFMELAVVSDGLLLMRLIGI